MNILIIQLLRLGDALQIIPIIHGLKSRFPQARIQVLTSTIGKTIFEKDDQVEQVFVLRKEIIGALERRSRPQDLKAGMEMLDYDLEPLFHFQWDWIINFSFSFPSALICFLLDAEHSSGYLINDRRQYFSKDKWFCHSLASFGHRRYSNFNWVDVNKRILGLSQVPHQPLLKPDPQAELRVKKHLQQIGFLDRRIIGIHPGASIDYKRWPLDKFKSLSQILTHQYDYRLLIFGDQKEINLGQSIQQAAGSKSLNLAGQTTLDELSAYLRNCHLLVSNDSGPMHLAAGLGTKTLALYFNSHFVETGPYAAGHIAVHPDLPCFPCQGPARCLSKECLQQIHPATLEKLIQSQAHSNGIGRVSLDGDKAKAYISAFDPWDMLEWIPLNHDPLAFQDLERLLLKTAWLYHNHISSDNPTLEKEYLLKSLNHYRITHPGELIRSVCRFIEQALVFKKQLETTGQQAFDLQNELLSDRTAAERIKTLGDRLSQAENAITHFAEGSSLTFLSELLAVLRENIEQQDLLSLATKTVRIYSEIAALLDSLIDRAEKVSAYLTQFP